MRRSEIMKSSAFRLALAFSALFFVTFIAAGFIGYQIILSDLRDRLDRNLSDTFEMISRSYTDGDLEDLVGTVKTYVASTRGHDRIFSLVDGAGLMLAGNLPLATVPTGLSTASAAALGLEGDLHFRVKQGVVAGNTLVVGASFEETDELSSLTLSSFGWAGTIAAAIAIVAGIVLAGAVRKRIDVIAGTMSEVGHGVLRARIPLRGSNDDIDILSGQINVALDRLAALVEGMRQVSVDIAHDLKTPLNRLAITVESAIEADELGKPVASLLRRAQEEGARINETFDALLRIAQIEAGARRARFAAVTPATILESIAEAYGEVAVENEQTLSLTLLEGLPPIHGDRELLVQMLANLVENAIRHCPPGASIRLSGGLHGEQVELAVSDNGPGIPAGEREKVFQRLYRVEKSRTTSGTGLGLSLVKAVCDLHGATVVLGDNAPGLVVTVRFPVLPATLKKES
jgi:signal transduction histidine kinase